MYTFYDLLEFKELILFSGIGLIVMQYYRNLESKIIQYTQNEISEEKKIYNILYSYVLMSYYFATYFNSVYLLAFII